MNKKLRVLLLSLFGSTLIANVHADNHSDGPNFSPVDLIACNFNDGQGMSNLNRVIARWNTWMDEKGDESYWAYILTPTYFSQDITFDFAWAGGWPDGKSMAAGRDLWVKEGQSLRDEFARVASCQAQGNFATVRVKANSTPFPEAPVEFSNCKMKGGRTPPEAFRAMAAWSAHLEKSGLDVGHWMFFPAYGEASAAEYDFKAITVHNSYEEFGKHYDHYGNGRGFEVADRTLNLALDCDSARVYHGRPIRKVDTSDDE